VENADGYGFCTICKTAICCAFVREILAPIRAFDGSPRGEGMKKKTKNAELAKSQKTKRNVNRHFNRARANRHIRAKVDGQLRRAYDQIVDEGTPDRFVQLFKQLARGKDEEDST
jgi:hypothetical protein